MNEQTEIDVATLLNWSAPKLTPTVKGDRYLRKAEPNETFWRKIMVGRNKD